MVGMSLQVDVSAVDDAVDTLGQHAWAVSEAGDPVVVSSMWSLGRDATIIEATRTELVGEWDRRQVWALDGSRSAAARLARETGMGIATARRMVRRARRLRSMAATRAAFAAGEVGVEQVDALCRANSEGREEFFVEAEERLLGDAGRLGADDFNRVVQRWIDAADDARAGDRARRDREGRYLACHRRLDGNVEVAGRLDPVAGSAILDELARLERQLFLQDWDEARQQWGDEVCLDKLARTSAQRRADALVLMAARSAGADGVARPLFSVHLDLATFTRLVTGRPASDPSAEAGESASVVGCEMADGTIVTPHHLVPWLTEADVERVVFGPASRIIDLGRRSRLFRGGARRALDIRDRSCTFPGCDVPASACDADHVVEWSDGGETNPSNGRLLCGPHNRLRPGRRPSQPQADDPP